MKILAVLPLIPWPLDRGDRMRAWELLQELTLHGELSVVIVARGAVHSEARTALEALAPSVHVFGVGSVPWNILAGVAHGLPPALGAYWSPQVAGALRAIQGSTWDLVVAFQLRAAPYALAVKAPVHAIDFTDSLSMFRRRLPWLGRSGLQRILLTGVDRVEAKAAVDFDLAWISAADDRQAIGEISGRYPQLVPNACVPVDRPAPYEVSGPLLFMGDMRYPANEDGIIHFMKTAWPAICRGCDGCRLRVAGRFTRRVVRAARHPGVEILGPLEDVGQELAGAGAVINPVRFGSGSSRKVLAGWAAARPVISTRSGARGLAYEDGRDILLADPPEAWLAAVQALRARPGAAEALGRAGWLRARSEHDASRAWAGALTAPSLAARSRATAQMAPGSASM